VAADIRFAASADLNRLVEIYNHYVLETHITFDTEPFAVAERIQWFNQFADTGGHRLLVAERYTWTRSISGGVSASCCTALWSTS
jgi:phosphinothricin acetyltransferase